MFNLFLWMLVLGGLFVVAIWALSGIRLLYQYERGVVFTLGRYSGTRNPGLIWIAPIF